MLSTMIKPKNQILAVAVGLSTLLTGCDKGGSSFSVLSETSSYQQNTSFTPRKVDVMFVIDNSGSMSTSQNNLAVNFPSFINSFISKGYDFRIAVGTTDAFYGEQFLANGCSLCNVNQTQFRSGVTPTPVYIIDRSDYDLDLQSEKDRLIQEFTLNAKVGVKGSGDERAFSSIKALLGSPLNSNFRRADAFLAVIIVSDEEDFSQNNYDMNESYSNPELHPVVNYKNFLDTFTNGQPSLDYSVSSISILDEACRSSLGSGRKIGNRYIELANLTGGTTNSLCAPFDQTLDNISATIQTQMLPVFQLSKKPIVNSIRVIIDDVLVPENTVDGWSYDAIANTITINGSTFKPTPNSKIIINFDPDLN